MMLINWNRFIVNLLPIRLRTASVYGLIRAMFAPIIDLYNRFQTYDASIKYDLVHNSQTWSIQALLNDAFDPHLRRIYIDDAGGLEPIAIGSDADGDQIIAIGSDAEGDQIIAINGDSAYTGGSWNAVIVLPFSISESEMYRLRALVDKFRLAGIRYDVINN